MCLKITYSGLMDLLCDVPICSSCIKGIKDLLKIEKINGIEYMFLYEYNNFFRELIYLYKGRYNISLSKVFVYKYQFYLKYKYRKYTFLCAPSSKVDDAKRGFNHVYEVAKCISNKVMCPFYKKSDWKQSDKHGDERKGICDVIGVNLDMIKGLKKVVIIDDIYSTGNTIKSCIRHLNEKCDIRVLCVCRNMLKK